MQPVPAECQGHGESRYPSALPFVRDGGAKGLQVRHQGVHFSLAFDRIFSASNVGVGVRHTQGAHGSKFGGGVFAVQLVLYQPWVCRHDRLRHDVAWVVEVGTVPVIGVTTANASQVRTGTLGAPQEWVIPDAFTGYRVVTITLGLGTERTNHLRVAANATFTDEDVAAFMLQGGTRLHAFHWGVGDVLEEQWHDLHQTTDADGKDHQQGHQADIFFNDFVIHLGSPQAICAAACISAGLAACTVRQVL